MKVICPRCKPHKVHMVWSRQDLYVCPECDLFVSLKQWEVIDSRKVK